VRRRQFITLLGGAAAWPLAARAQQQGERMRRIGVLLSSSADDPLAQTLVGALSQGLQELGWVLGRNLRVDYRWAAVDAGAHSDANGTKRKCQPVAWQRASQGVRPPVRSTAAETR
jgi:hypothetical protein